MSILNDDINQLKRFLDIGANDLIQITTTVLVIGGLFAYIAPEVAWLALLQCPWNCGNRCRFQRELARTMRRCGSRSVC